MIQKLTLVKKENKYRKYLDIKSVQFLQDILFDVRRHLNKMISLFVLLIVGLIVFQPFILATIHLEKKITAIVCISIAFLLTMIFQSSIFPNLFYPKINYREWNLSQQILFNLFLLFSSSTLSFLLITIFYFEKSFSAYLTLLSYSLVINIIPQFLHTLLLVSGRKKEEAQEISRQNCNEEKSVLLENGKKLKMDKNIIYIKAEDNYISLNSLLNGEITKKLERISIAKVHQCIDDNFVQCHRSYIVNLNAIEKIVKQKLRFYIKLNGIENLIPVSRGKMHFFRNFPITNSPQK